MKGTVTQINPGRAMVAVRIDTGDYVIFEVIGGEEFEIGDVVSWPAETPLGDFVTNHRSSERAGVVFQHFYVHANQVRKLLLY
jgi:hypothetical protein